MTGPADFTSYVPIENNFGRTDRYSYAIVEHDNKKLFLKTSLKPVGIGDIRRELVWADFMAIVERQHPAARIRSPRDIQLLDESNLLMEHIAAPVVAEPGDAVAWGSHIDRYIDVLTVLDKTAETYVVPDSLRTYKSRSLDDTLKRWLRDIDTTPDIDQGLDCVRQHESKLDYRLQHGDLTPWQIFDVSGDWVIFDGERAGDDLPRYNDLAYSYGRLAIKCRDIEAADYMLSQFIHRQELEFDVFWDDFMPVALFRVLGMIGDAARDKSSADLSIARSLLQDILSGTVVSKVWQ